MVKTIIGVDVKKPAWEQDPKTPLHNRWHPDIPAVSRVKEGELFRVECRRGVLDRADGVSGRMCQPPRHRAGASTGRADRSRTTTARTT